MLLTSILANLRAKPPVERWATVGLVLGFAIGGVTAEPKPGTATDNNGDLTTSGGTSKQSHLTLRFRRMKQSEQCVSRLVPFVRVVDVETSVAFYRHLGFTVQDVSKYRDRLSWASLQSEQAGP